MAWNRLSASRSLPRAREYTRNLVFGNFAITMLRYFTRVKCKEYINFATLMFPLQKRWKFLFYALHSSSCILDLSDLRQYRRFVWKLPLPGLHFATAATRSFVPAAETRSSFSCGWLFVERRHFLLTHDCIVSPAIRSPSGILHRVSNRKYRFASARLGLLAPFYPKERDL